MTTPDLKPARTRTPDLKSFNELDAELFLYVHPKSECNIQPVINPSGGVYLHCETCDKDSAPMLEKYIPK